MKKAEFVTKLTSKVEGLTVDQASKAINGVFEILAEVLENGDSYSHDNFGGFKVVGRAARKGRNPKTGEEIEIDAKNAVKFTVSPQLKKRVEK